MARLQRGAYLIFLKHIQDKNINNIYENCLARTIFV